LASHAKVFWVDISDLIIVAVKNFKEFNNLFFFKGISPIQD
jgi:hypothetical protein